MQNQSLTEPETEASYTLPALAQNEFTNAPADVQTKLEIAETQSVQNTQAVHEWLASIQQKAHRDKRRFWTILIVLLLAGFLPLSLLLCVPSLISNINPLMPLMLMLTSLGMLCLGFALNLKMPKWHADEIARVGGTQAVGTLLELLTAPNGQEQKTPIYGELTELLPKMKASNAAHLTGSQRRLLYTLLKNGTSPGVDSRLFLNFRLAILKALEQVGDADAIPIVEHMANGLALTPRQKQLKAAQECLPLLRVKFGTVEANKMLLRASSPALAAPKTLLRPSEFTPDANSNQLLHASDTTVPRPPSL